MFKKVIIFLAVTITQLDGASQLTHAYLAKKWLALNPKSEEYRGAFIRGTLFPDIRYFANLSRELTHEKNVTLKEISSCQDPFEAGKKFHAFVDESRELMVKKAKIKRTATKIVNKKTPLFKKYVTMLLKFAEDEIIFTMNDQCTDIAQYLGPIDPQMRTYKVPDQKLQVWYASLKKWCFSGASLSSVLIKYQMDQQNTALFLTIIPAHDLPNFGLTIQALAQNNHIKTYTKQLLDDFDKTFKKFLKKQKTS